MKRSWGTGALAAVFVYLALLVPATAVAGPAPPLTGYVIHFDCISDTRESLRLVRFASSSGAKVINIVPPAHIWENRKAVRMLDTILTEAARLQLSVLFTRIDASWPPDARGRRWNYLYGKILTEPGRMPNGRRSSKYFLATAGRAGYAQWMEEETRYYAGRYGRLSNLLGINLGPFSEPFSSERGGFLEYLRETGRYELTQYTPEAARLWHDRLLAMFQDIARVNRAYGTSFPRIDAVPLPRSESDERFGLRADVAYFDFVCVLNDWFIERYERCRRIWHEASGRKDVPFILQFSGNVSEKLALARPGASAFDLAGWIARADAVGLSLYTNNGYVDFGHASVRATVRLLSLARDLGKDVFVLEGGCEAPNVVLDENELRFFATAAAPLTPRVWIYEFLKDKFNEGYRVNPGKLVRADGSIRPRAVNLISSLFAEIRNRPTVEEKPCLAVMVDTASFREDPDLERASLALFDLAATVPLRWATPVSMRALPPDTPFVRLGRPRGNDAVTHMLVAAPEPGTKARREWTKRFFSVYSAGR